MRTQTEGTLDGNDGACWIERYNVGWVKDTEGYIWMLLKLLIIIYLFW